MVANSSPEQAVELLEKLGLKEYEAKTFVALTQIPNGTAREVSNVSEVPRTRVYDAVEALEADGLVEIQHANPQRFQAVSIDEAVQTLRTEYESRTATLRETLKNIRPINQEREDEVAQQVWSLAGRAAITSRIRQLLQHSDTEVVLLLGDESDLRQPIKETLNDATSRGVAVYVGTSTAERQTALQQQLAGAEVFTSDWEWLREPEHEPEEPVIKQLLLVDEENILVSTGTEQRTGNGPHETAVFGQGFDNGFVTLVRRLVAADLFPVDTT